MSAKRHTGFVAVILSIIMVCAVLMTSFVPSDSLNKMYICYSENPQDSGVSGLQTNASLIPKPIKEASFEEAVSAMGWIKSEKLGAVQLDSVFRLPVAIADVPAGSAVGYRGCTKLLCRLLI